MSYVHCHECGWSQDDFYEVDGYNPLYSNWMDHYADALLKEKINITEMMRDYQEYINKNNESKHVNKKGPWSNFDPLLFCWQEGNQWFMSGQHYVVYHLRGLADRIEEQIWMTKEDFLNSEIKDCPECGSSLCED